MLKICWQHREELLQRERIDVRAREKVISEKRAVLEDLTLRRSAFFRNVKLI